MPFPRRRVAPRAAPNRDPERLVVGTAAWKEFVADTAALPPSRRTAAGRQALLEAMRDQDRWPEPLRNDLQARLEDIATRAYYAGGTPRCRLTPRDWHLTVASNPVESERAAEELNAIVEAAEAEGADVPERIATALARLAAIGGAEPEPAAVAARVAAALADARPGPAPR